MIMRPVNMIASLSVGCSLGCTYCALSKLFLDVSSRLSPESPKSPNIVMKTSASVPAPFLSPVNTVTLYLQPVTTCQRMMMCHHLQVYVWGDVFIWFWIYIYNFYFINLFIILDSPLWHISLHCRAGIFKAQLINLSIYYINLFIILVHCVTYSDT